LCTVKKIILKIKSTKISILRKRYSHTFTKDFQEREIHLEKSGETSTKKRRVKNGLRLFSLDLLLKSGVAFVKFIFSITLFS